MKKTKLIIVLTLVVSILVSAGAGAGTYAYFSQHLGTSTNTINVVEFDPSAQFIPKDFTLNNFAPDKSVYYSVKLMQNNTKLDLIYQTKLIVKSINSSELSLYNHDGIQYKFYLDGNKKYVKAFKDESGNKQLKYFKGNGDEISLVEPAKQDEEDETAYLHRLIRWYSNKGFPYLALDETWTDDTFLKEMSFTAYTFADFDKSTEPGAVKTIHYAIDWPYESIVSSVDDMDYLGNENTHVILDCTAIQTLNHATSADASKTFSTTTDDNKSVLLNYNLHWGASNSSDERAWIRVDGSDREPVTAGDITLPDATSNPNSREVEIKYNATDSAKFIVHEEALWTILKEIKGSN